MRRRPSAETPSCRTGATTLKPAVLMALFSLMAVTACAHQAPLTPKPSENLPVAPIGGSARPSAAELLKLPPQAIVTRGDELETRSQVRTDDPFDLPPD